MSVAAFLPVEFTSLPSAFLRTLPARQILSDPVLLYPGHGFTARQFILPLAGPAKKEEKLADAGSRDLCDPATATACDVQYLSECNLCSPRGHTHRPH